MSKLKTYNEAIINLINANKWQKHIDKEHQNVNSY